MYVVRRLEVDDGAEPGMVQERARGVALRKDRDRQAREQNSRGYSRPGEEDHLNGVCRANYPVEASQDDE